MMYKLYIVHYRFVKSTMYLLLTINIGIRARNISKVADDDSQMKNIIYAENVENMLLL